MDTNDTTMRMTLEDFAELYPDEYNDYVDDMYELYGHEDPIDYPEDWQVYA